MKKFGPYGPNHATAGTFAFKRKLLKQHKYNDEACLAEERAFLKDYTVPFVQLNPMKVILVFSHEHNTFDKRKLLVNANPQVVKDTPKRVMDFIKDPVLRKFYMVDLEKILVDYLPGRPEMKPDVIQQTLQLERDRERMAAEQAQQMNGGGGDNGQIILQQPGQEPVALSNKQVVEIIQQQQGEIQNRDKKIHQMNEEIKKLQFDLYNLRKVVEKNAENADDDNELKIVEIVDKPANVDTTHVTNQDKNTTNCPPDLMKRYEDLLEENREMRRLLDDLTQTNTNAELM
jgi:hypothetical protein